MYNLQPVNHKQCNAPKNIRRELLQHAQSRTNMQPQQMLKKASAPYTENNLAQLLVKEGASKNHFKNIMNKQQIQFQEGMRFAHHLHQPPLLNGAMLAQKRDIFNIGSDSLNEDIKEEYQSSSEQLSDQEEQQYNLQTSEGKVIKKEFELSFEEDEVGESTMNKGFVVPQNSINPGNVRRGEVARAMNNRDSLRHFEQDDPPEDDDYSSLVPPYNQQKNTLLAHQQHPGHHSHLSSSCCSPEVMRVPDNNQEDYQSSSDYEQYQSQLGEPYQICKKCRKRISSVGELKISAAQTHTCVKHSKRIIPQSHEDNDDHNIAIMEEPEEMKVQLIGNIHYNLNRAQNHQKEEDTANVVVSGSSFDQSQQLHNSRYLNNENSRYARGEATSFRLDWFIYQSSQRSSNLREHEDSIPRVTTTSLEDTATLSQTDITMLQPHHMINNNPSQMMPVQQSFSSRTRQQIESSNQRRRQLAAVINDERRINLVSGNPSRLLHSSRQQMIQEMNNSNSSSENNINSTQVLEHQSAASTNQLDLTQDGSGHLMQHRIAQWQQYNQGFMRAMNEANSNRRIQPDMNRQQIRNGDQRMRESNFGADEEDEIPRTQTVLSTNLGTESVYGLGGGHATAMISLGMPRMQDYQQIHNLNPNARGAIWRNNNQDDQAVSTGLLSRNSSTSDEMPDRYIINRHQINQEEEESENNQTDDDQHQNVNVTTSLNLPAVQQSRIIRRRRLSDSQTDEEDHQLQTQEEEEEKIFIFQRPVEAFIPFRGTYADYIQDEVADMRPSARESSIGRSLNMMRPPNQHQPLNLRPRLQPFAQNHIHNQSEDSYHDHVETAIQNNSLNSNRMMRRGARIQPFGLIHPGHAHMIANDDEEDEWSSRSYNYIGEDDATFIDHIVNRANNFRNFDDYEALLNLDDNIVQSVPQRYIEQLPKSAFTEGNRENFTEENKSCTICMCPYELQDEFMILPCLHRFHSPCITEWFARRNTCPNCKDRVLDHFDQQNQHCSMIKPPGRCLDNNQSSSLESNLMRIVRRGGASGNHNNDFVHEEEEKNDADGEQEDDDDDDLMNTRVQYVQGQSIQRFVPRTRFVIEATQQNENRNNNQASNSIRNMMNTLSQYTERINNATQAYNFSQTQLQNQQDQMSQIRSHLQEHQQNQHAFNRHHQEQQQRPMIDFDVTSSEDMAENQDYQSSLL